MSITETNIFLNRFAESVNAKEFIKLTLSERRYKDNDLKNVFVKPVILKSGPHLSFVYRYPTKDITKNYPWEEALEQVQAMIDKNFYQCVLFTSTGDVHLAISKNGKAVITDKAAVITQAPAPEHDRAKKRFVNPENNIYLRELGITTAEGKVKSDRQDKYRQINKYVEIVENLATGAALPLGFTVADMGSGKGYLTFALYDYLTNTMNLSPKITGVEMRQELVDNCNQIVAKTGFTKLSFSTGAIDTVEIPAVDMLIALHACDTATDQAIYRGIKGGSKVIICAPCCHRQLRKQMHPENDLKAISKYGILEERQAEILTDTIRALILEYFGYKTKVFEFISTEHTPKNVMIAAIKTNIATGNKNDILQQIKSIKSLFNIEYHQLERLMEI